MLEEYRPVARITHLVFALLLASVAYALTWYTLQDARTRWRYALSCTAAVCAGLLSHAVLDWWVGVP
jgi:hypothetical protein